MNNNEHDAENPFINARVFSEKRMTLGIPVQMFVILMALNIFAVILLIKFFSIFSLVLMGFFVLITWMPIYQIHKNDPDAWLVWLGTLLVKTRLNNDSFFKRKVVFIKLKN